MAASSGSIRKELVNVCATGGMSPSICIDSGAGNKQRLQQDPAALDSSGPPKTIYRWRKLKIKYSEEVLRMYPYLAEPDSDGEDDIGEGEEDEYVRWDPVQKVHVKRETPLQEIAKEDIAINPTVGTNKFLPEDMVTVEILLKVISGADDNFRLKEADISPTRAPTIPEPSSSNSDFNSVALSEVSIDKGGLGVVLHEEQTNARGADILSEYDLPERIHVPPSPDVPHIGSKSFKLPNILSSETSCQQDIKANSPATMDDMEIVTGDTKLTEEGVKDLTEPSRYFVAGVKNGLLHSIRFNECNPEHRFHDFRGCRNSRKAALNYRRIYKRPMFGVTYRPRSLRSKRDTHIRDLDDDRTASPICEGDVGNSPSGTGSSYNWEFFLKNINKATDLGYKTAKSQNLWGALEIDPKLRHTHSDGSHKTSMNVLDLVNCGYIPLEKPFDLIIGGYFGFSAYISENALDYDRNLVHRCLSVAGGHSSSEPAMKQLPYTSPDMARELAYQKGEAAGRRHMVEVAMKVAIDIFNKYPKKIDSVDTNLMKIERALQRAALGFYEEAHNQHESASDNEQIVHKYHPPHMELWGEGLCEGDEVGCPEAFKTQYEMSDHSFKERPLSSKSTDYKRKHHEFFEEARDSSRKRRRRRSVSRENDSHRRRNDKSHSFARDSNHRDDGRSSSPSYKASRRRKNTGHSYTKRSRESGHRYYERDGPDKSCKGSRRRYDHNSLERSRSRSHSRSRRHRNRHRQHDEYNDLSTTHKGSPRKKGDQETARARTRDKARSPDRGRRRSRGYESGGYYQIFKGVKRGLEHKHIDHTSSPQCPAPVLEDVNPPKKTKKESITEISRRILKQGIFETPKVRNEQGGLHEVGEPRRSLQGNFQSSTVSEFDESLKDKKLRAETNSLKERSISPQQSSASLRKKSASNDEPSQVDVHMASDRLSSVKENKTKEVLNGDFGALGVRTHMERSKAYQTLETESPVKNLSIKEAPSVEAHKSLQKRSSPSRVVGKEVLRAGAQQSPKIVNLVTEVTGKEEASWIEVHSTSPQRVSSMARKGQGNNFFKPPSGPRSLESNYPQGGSFRDQQPPNIYGPQEHHSQGQQPSNLYGSQESNPQVYQLQELYGPQGCHSQGHNPPGHNPPGHYSQDNYPQGHRIQDHSFRGHGPTSHQHSGYHPPTRQLQGFHYQNNSINSSVIPNGNFGGPRSVRRSGYRGNSNRLNFGWGQDYIENNL